MGRIAGPSRGARRGGIGVLFLLLAWLAAPRAWAEDKVRVLAAGRALSEPEARAAFDPIFADLGFRRVTWWLPGDLESRIRIVPVLDLGAREACGGPMSLSGWRERIHQAHEQLQLLQFEEALAGAVALELEVGCLEGVPEPEDLFLLALVLADAHRLAGSAAAQPGMRLFHEGEMRRALDGAAAFAPGLPPPAWLDPDLARDLSEVQATYTLERAVPAYLLLEPGFELWVDGRRQRRGPHPLAPGTHLVQVLEGDEVVAGGRIRVSGERSLLVQAAPGAEPLQVADILAALEALAREGEPLPLLAPLPGLLAKGVDRAVIAVRTPEGPQLWGRGRDGLTRFHPPPDPPSGPAPSTSGPSEPPPRLEGPRSEELVRIPAVHFRFRLGGGPATLVTDLEGGALEGLGGMAAGVALQGRVAVTRSLSMALAVHPVARVEELPASYEDTWLFRAMVPVRWGLRLGVPRDRPGLEVGIDGGVLYLGRFEHQELRGFGVLAGGGWIPLGPSVAVVGELWGGFGPDLITAGVQATIAFQGGRAPGG